MKIYAVSAAAAGLIVAAALFGTGAAFVTSSGQAGVLAVPCKDSLGPAADWAIAESEQSGKSVSIVKRARIVLKISSVCSCVQEALASHLPESKWPMAGAMTGISCKKELALRAKDKAARDRARDTARDELKKVMPDYKLSLNEVVALGRTIDSALSSCGREHLSRR